MRYIKALLRALIAIKVSIGIFVYVLASLYFDQSFNASLLFLTIIATHIPDMDLVWYLARRRSGKSDFSVGSHRAYGHHPLLVISAVFVSGLYLAEYAVNPESWLFIVAAFLPIAWTSFVMAMAVDEESPVMYGVVALFVTFLLGGIAFGIRGVSPEGWYIATLFSVAAALHFVHDMCNDVMGVHLLSPFSWNHYRIKEWRLEKVSEGTLDYVYQDRAKLSLRYDGAEIITQLIECEGGLATLLLFCTALIAGLFMIFF